MIINEIFWEYYRTFKGMMLKLEFRIVKLNNYIELLMAAQNKVTINETIISCGKAAFDRHKLGVSFSTSGWCWWLVVAALLITEIRLAQGFRITGTYTHRSFIFGALPSKVNVCILSRAFRKVPNFSKMYFII